MTFVSGTHLPNAVTPPPLTYIIFARGVASMPIVAPSLALAVVSAAVQCPSMRI